VHSKNTDVGSSLAGTQKPHQMLSGMEHALGRTRRKAVREVVWTGSMTVQIDERKIVAGLFELITSTSSPDWFTEQELAVYLRLVNKDGKPVTSGIRKWAARAPEENPLPRRYIGDLPRFFRPEVIRWTEEETKRHHSKTKLLEPQENGVVTAFPIQEDNANALTAAAS
jgi:hypothetical protein